jgi:uncharacterized protein YidB (DUF937 family)
VITFATVNIVRHSRRAEITTLHAPGAQPSSDQGAGGLLGGLGGLLDKLQNGGLGNVINSWIGHGQNQPVSPGQLGSALGPTDFV